MESELKSEITGKKNQPVNEIIRIINSIVKSILIFTFSGVICYKLIISNINFDFSKFDFSDLLTLILAIFSISLSVVFYFKATETSNLFYDNTYKFTKEISEILGRIEAGFGERLKHLDEGYSGLRSKFDVSFNEKSSDLEASKKALEEEKKKIEVQTKEKEEIIQELMTKAKLSQNEKDLFTSKIKEKDDQINSLNNQLNEYKRNVIEREDIRDFDMLRRVPPSIRNFLEDYIFTHYSRHMIIEAPAAALIETVKLNPNHISKMELERLFSFGIITPDGSFTMAGIELIKSIVKRRKE